jgi:SAM-dependent methyltransferase
VTDPSDIVQQGFDALGERYLAWQQERAEDPRRPYLDRFTSELPEGARVLDLGCGPGFPVTRLLAERFDATGVDISGEQLRLARMQAPGARFVQADIAELTLPEGSFEGITALFSLSHTPRAGHAMLFARIASWLTPGGLFLGSFRAQERRDVVHPWGGVPMYSSNYGAETSRRLLREAGLELVLDEVRDLAEPEGDVAYLWVMARRRTPSA